MASSKIKEYWIHPLLVDVEKFLRYHLIGAMMMVMPDFQKVTIEKIPCGSLDLTVDFDFRSLTFYTQKTIEQFNRDYAVKKDNLNMLANLKEFLVSEAQLISISLWDGKIKNSKYENKLDRNLKELVIHLRNAAAHNNLFYFKDKLIPTVNWRNKTILSKDEGAVVFGSFMTAADLIVLIIDISIDLKRIDEEYP